MSLVLQDNLKLGSIGGGGGGGSGGVDDVKVDGTSVVTSGVANIDLTGKIDKTTISTSSEATLLVTLVDNTIYNNTNSALSTLTVTEIANPTVDFGCQINFTSGSTATTVTPNANIVYTGDNVNENTGFVPRANCRYTVVYIYDGNNIRGMVQGVSL